jgi:hypothetical protein
MIVEHVLRGAALMVQGAHNIHIHIGRSVAGSTSGGGARIVVMLLMRAPVGTALLRRGHITVRENGHAREVLDVVPLLHSHPGVIIRKAVGS